MLFAIAVIVSSCARHFYGELKSSAQLTQNNFSYIGNVTGKASAKYFLDFGGYKHSALMNEAKQDLYKQHPLKAGQAYVNISTDAAIKFWLLGYKKTYTINADIVQFLEDKYHKPDTTFSSSNNSKPIEKWKEVQQPFFKVGDYVTFKNSSEQIKNGRVTLMSFSDSTAYIEVDNEVKHHGVKFNQVLKPNLNKDGFAVNDKANIEIGGKYYKCVIISTSDDGAMVKLLEEPFFEKKMFATYNILKK